jgi:hypothetical protein
MYIDLPSLLYVYCPERLPSDALQKIAAMNLLETALLRWCAGPYAGREVSGRFRALHLTERFDCIWLCYTNQQHYPTLGADHSNCEFAIPATE